MPARWYGVTEVDKVPPMCVVLIIEVTGHPRDKELAL